MATCLVTGGAGFLGSHLCDELLRRGHRVVCVDNVETGSLANIEHIRVPEFRFLQADIIQPYFVDEPVDVVYHFASPASPIDYLELPIQTLKVGSLGTHNALGLARAKGARFMLELKPTASPEALARAVVERVRRARGRVAIASFDPRLLDAVQQLSEEVEKEPLPAEHREHIQRFHELLTGSERP